MERLTYFDGGKWRLKIGDTEHSGQWVDRLAAYEETGMEPEDIISATDMAKIACALHELNTYKKIGPIDRLRELAQADKDGKIKAYIVDSFYCDICQKRHARTKEIEVYLTRNAAEAALRREQDGQDD